MATGMGRTEKTMPRQSVFDMKLSMIYPLLVAKTEKRGCSKAEVDEPAKGKPMEKVLR